jgi:hypothetical protein
MADIDHSAVIKEGTGGDQKRLGTFRLHQRELQAHFRDLMAEGVTDPAIFENTMVDFLRQFETIRVTQERQIAKYEQQIAYCRARQRAASEHANLILAILTTQVDHAIKAKKAQVLSEKSDSSVITDTELLKKICICGCQDEEDALDCDCKCHTDGFCKEENCLVCKEKRLSSTAKKKKSKKKVRKSK